MNFWLYQTFTVSIMYLLFNNFPKISETWLSEVKFLLKLRCTAVPSCTWDWAIRKLKLKTRWKDLASLILHGSSDLGVMFDVLQSGVTLISSFLEMLKRLKLEMRAPEFLSNENIFVDKMCQKRLWSVVTLTINGSHAG